ncbi:universal stress protein [Pedococcus sp. KACC 23699]|uniref:Universal stress protein n=1 Tax=Pedococcus sp. KACC 23699 TaxID=3149228 RepID=A0AAU7JS91_9MICO
MTQHAPPVHSDTSGPEVVIGLVNDGQAFTVALRGVELAAELGASVRFVQVVPVGLSSADRAEAESSTFAAGLKALRHGHHRGATFESPGGDPGQLLVARSARAVGLVLGEDRARGDATEHSDVAEYCRAHALCPVHVVPRTGASAQAHAESRRD